MLSVNELLSSDPDEEFVAICSPLYNDYHLQSRYLHDAYYNPVTRRNYPYRDLFYDGKCHHFQKQPSEVLCKKLCSQKFRKIHRKTPVPESLF